MAGSVIVITSGKGGVGKTTTSANIGTALAHLGYKVVLIDTGGKIDYFNEECALLSLKYIIASNDIEAVPFILDLENFEWARIELYSNTRDFKVISRYGHKSTIFSNKLIIFGGMNNNNYIGSSLFIVNLDFSYTNQQRSIQEIMMNGIQA